MDKVYLDWNDIYEKCSVISHKYLPPDNNFKGVYGVPRGGIPPAVIIARDIGLKVIAPEPGVLVVDDIIDSGTTKERYTSKGYVFEALVDKEKEFPGKWVVFPWELEDNELPAEDSVIRIIEAIGEDPSREGLLKTPKRVVKSWEKLFGGYGMNPKEILKTTFESDEYDEMVVLREVEFYSTCEHHLLPFYGKAKIGYIPDGKVVGVSKLARLVECYSRRLQIQERLTKQIAGAIQSYLNPLGVGVVMKAKHLCMMARGIEKQNSEMVTSAMYGFMRDKPEARAEFMGLGGHDD